MEPMGGESLDPAKCRGFQGGEVGRGEWWGRGNGIGGYGGETFEM